MARPPPRPPKGSNTTPTHQERSFWTGLGLLGFDPVFAHTKWRVETSALMFRRGNVKGMELVLNFLLAQLDPTTAASKRSNRGSINPMLATHSNMKGIFPPSDKKASAEFKKNAYDLMMGLEKAGELPPNTVRLSHLQTAGGDRFITLIFRLTMLAVKTTLYRDYNGADGPAATAVPIHVPVIPKSSDRAKVDAMASAALTSAHARIDAAATSLSHAFQQGASAQLKWVAASESIVAEYTAVSAALRKLSNARAALGADDPLSEKALLNRTPQISTVSSAWDGLIAHGSAASEDRALIRKVLAGAAHEHRLDDAQLAYTPLPTSWAPQGSSWGPIKDPEGALELTTLVKMWKSSLSETLNVLNSHPQGPQWLGGDNSQPAVDEASAAAESTLAQATRLLSQVQLDISSISNNIPASMEAAHSADTALRSSLGLPPPTPSPSAQPRSSSSSLSLPPKTPARPFNPISPETPGIKTPGASPGASPASEAALLASVRAKAGVRVPVGAALAQRSASPAPPEEPTSVQPPLPKSTDLLENEEVMGQSPRPALTGLGFDDVPPVGSPEIKQTLDFNKALEASPEGQEPISRSLGHFAQSIADAMLSDTLGSAMDAVADPLPSLDATAGFATKREIPRTPLVPQPVPRMPASPPNTSSPITSPLPPPSAKNLPGAPSPAPAVAETGPAPPPATPPRATPTAPVSPPVLADDGDDGDDSDSEDDVITFKQPEKVIRSPKNRRSSFGAPNLSLDISQVGSPAKHDSNPGTPIRNGPGVDDRPSTMDPADSFSFPDPRPLVAELDPIDLSVVSEGPGPSLNRSNDGLDRYDNHSVFDSHAPTPTSPPVPTVASSISAASAAVSPLPTWGQGLADDLLDSPLVPFKKQS